MIGNAMPRLKSGQARPQTIWTMERQISLYKRHWFMRRKIEIINGVKYERAWLDVLGSLTKDREKAYADFVRALFNGDTIAVVSQDFIDQQAKYGCPTMFQPGTLKLDLVRGEYEATLTSKHWRTRVKNKRRAKFDATLTPEHAECVHAIDHQTAITKKHEKELASAQKRVAVYEQRMRETQKAYEEAVSWMAICKNLVDRAYKKIAELEATSLAMAQSMNRD
jgi:hypothetical protein